MSKYRSNRPARGAIFALAVVMIGSLAVALPGASNALDPGINQPGRAGNIGRDPGINQPGAAGNINRRGVGR